MGVFGVLVVDDIARQASRVLLVKLQHRRRQQLRWGMS